MKAVEVLTPCRPLIQVMHGVRAVWNLRASDSVAAVVVPASHKSVVPPPPDVLTGADDMATTERVRLRPGDCLLCAATLLSGVAKEPEGCAGLWEAEFVAANAAATGAAAFAPESEPGWMQPLSPEQKAVVGPRTIGGVHYGRGPGPQQPSSAPSEERWYEWAHHSRGGLISDGQTVAVDHHPGVIKPGFRAPHAAVGTAPVNLNNSEATATEIHPGISHKELWFWDLNGYLVSPVMDETWIEDALAAVELFSDRPELLEEVPEAVLRENDWRWPDELSPRLSCPVDGQEHHRPRLGHLYELPAPHNQPFLK